MEKAMRTIGATGVIRTITPQGSNNAKHTKLSPYHCPPKCCTTRGRGGGYRLPRTPLWTPGLRTGGQAAGDPRVKFKPMGLIQITH